MSKLLLLVHVGLLMTLLLPGPGVHAQQPPGVDDGPKKDRTGMDLDHTQDEKRFSAFEKVQQDQSQILLNLAREYRAEGRHRRAIELYREFLIRFPRSKNAYSACIEAAEILERLNRGGDAADYYMRAYRIDGGSIKGGEALLQAGRILIGIGEYQRGMALLEKIETEFPYSRLAKEAELEKKQLRFSDFSQENLEKKDPSNATESVPGEKPKMPVE